MLPTNLFSQAKTCSTLWGCEIACCCTTSHRYFKPLSKAYILISFATLAADELSAIGRFFRHQERRSTKPLPGRAGGKPKGWSLGPVGINDHLYRHLELKRCEAKHGSIHIVVCFKPSPMLYMCVIPIHCCLRHHLVQHKLPYEDINLMTWRVFLNRTICHNTLTRWLFQLFLFSPLLGEDSHSD